MFTYPSAADLKAGRKLYYNDDTFVEPGGQALIANEEDNHAIVAGRDRRPLAERAVRPSRARRARTRPT